MMTKQRTKGQSVMGEYVILFMLVAVAVSAMLIYVRRALNGRVHDAQVYMVKSAVAGSQGTLDIPMEYEPYYARQIAKSKTNSVDQTKITEGGVYQKVTNVKRSADVNSYQLPPAMDQAYVQGLIDEKMFK